MAIIMKLITLTVSVVLILWIMRLKKNDPFPKGTIPKIIVGGLISCALAGLASFILMFLYAMIKYGPDLMQAINNFTAGDQNALDNLPTAEPSIWLAMFKSLVFIGFIEEFLKFSNMRFASKKPGTINNRFDAVALCALAGIAFQIFEDLTVTSRGSIGTVILRSVMPFHFTFEVIMGYFYGRYLDTKKGKDLFLTLAVPTIIHGIYDLCVLNVTEFDYLIIFALFAFATVFVLTIVMIVKVGKWSKKETMRAPFSGE